MPNPAPIPSSTGQPAGRTDRRRGHRFLRRRWSSFLRALPDFAIVGGQRCGSTSLHDYLIQHPRIAAPFVKEAHYFDRDVNFALGEAWYRAHFNTRRALARRDALTFDATPDTLFRRVALVRMREQLGPVPVIALLREPVARAYSAWNRRARRGKETLPFEAAVRRELDWLAEHGLDTAHTTRPGTGPRLRRPYLTRGIWAPQVAELIELFGRERVHAFVAEEFFADPQRVCDRIFDLLGLPPHELADVRVKNAREYDAPLEPGLRARLEAFYAPHNERLSRLLGCELPW